MEQNINTLSVTKLNKYIKNMLEEDVVLKDLFVSGEISNLKKHSSGHIYFTLKDNKCQVSSVMFKSYTNSLKFDLKEGMKVTCYGYVSMYEAYGTFQFYVEFIREDGIGTLAQKFLLLKEELKGKGYFDDKHKKQIPRFIKTVAVLTARDGAAVKDVIRTIKRRNYLIKIIVVPTIVQGVLSKDSIVQNIKDINQYSLEENIDVIILGRGGGSIEDLWSFNEEEVVKAIFESEIPIISAVGHEVDFTLADFVADFRASTPTSAGEAVSIELDSLVYTAYSLKKSLDDAIMKVLEEKRKAVFNLTNRSVLRRPENLIYNEQIRLNNLIKDLNNNIFLKLSSTRNQLSEQLTKLDLLNPVKILNKGYNLTYKDDKIIKSSNELKKDDEIKIKYSDGEIKAIVK